MTLDQFTEKTNDEKKYCSRPRIVCNDGFTMSVQGSYGHYCSPRITTGRYSSMEIGFPSKKETLIMEWAEEPKNPTKTVYGWTPCDVIQKVIDKHGGINKAETFKNKS